MSENKDYDNAPFNPLFYEENNFDYPSDRLTLRELRLLWPEPQHLGETISHVRAVEHFLAEGAAVEIDHRAEQGEPRPDPKISVPLPQANSEEHERQRAFLKTFYVETGLAPGDHAAELLIRGIEERALRQYRPAPRPR